MRYFLVCEQKALRTLFFLCVTVFLCQSEGAFAQSAIACPVPDRKGFSEFLKKFEDDVAFQRKRIVLPLVVREGEYTMTNVSISLWGMEKIKSLDYPLILSRAERAKALVAEDILLITKRYVEVFHDGPPESDLYRMLYKFRSIGGCWFLEELHDKSE